MYMEKKNSLEKFFVFNLNVLQLKVGSQEQSESTQTAD